MITSLHVFAAALVTALATGAGALPFLWRRTMSREALGLANALAAGLMVAASLLLLYEGIVYGLAMVVAGALSGALFILVTGRLIEGHGDVHLGALQGLDARKALLIVGVMTVHSFTEGVGVGVSFGGGQDLGVLITLAITVHNIPEGLAISLVLIPRGVSVGRAALWSIFSSLPQPLMALPAFWFVEAFRPFLPYGLGFAAGAMLWMVGRELLPEALEEAPAGRVAGVMGLSILGMLLFQWLLHAA